MDDSRSSWRRLVTLVLLLSIGLAGAPPAAASDVTSSPLPLATPLSQSVQRIVATTALAAAPRSSAMAQQAPEPKKTDLESPSFFKTPAGLIVIGVFAAGTGYALYSISHDRVRGSGR